MEMPAPSHTKTYRKLVADTTINTTTLLSTDYLNHYNEVIMLIDLCADMPEMLEEVKAWSPKSYAEHFQGSVFSHKDLAIAAYEHAPGEYRLPFDETVAALNAMVAEETVTVEMALAGGDMDAARVVIQAASRKLRQGVDQASGIINGVSIQPLDAEALGGKPAGVMDQAGIDALFD